MLKMSFFDGTLDREKAIKTIVMTKKPCTYTFGLRYRNPTTKDVYITKEEAIEIVKKESLLDIKEYEDRIDLNAYSSNDMW